MSRCGHGRRGWTPYPLNPSSSRHKSHSCILPCPQNRHPLLHLSQAATNAPSATARSPCRTDAPRRAPATATTPSDRGHATVATSRSDVATSAPSPPSSIVTPWPRHASPSPRPRPGASPCHRGPDILHDCNVDFGEPYSVEPFQDRRCRAPPPPCVLDLYRDVADLTLDPNLHCPDGVHRVALRLRHRPGPIHHDDAHEPCRCPRRRVEPAPRAPSCSCTGAARRVELLSTTSPSRPP